MLKVIIRLRGEYMKPMIGLTMHTGDGRFVINQAYIKSVESAGGIPICLPAITVENVEALLNKIDGLLVVGGYDIDPILFDEEPHPKLGEVVATRDASDLRVIRAAFEREMPILGVCRGHQVLNVAYGGSLIQDIDSQLEHVVAHHQKSARSQVTHTVNITGPKLQQIFGGNLVRTNSFHHQAVARVAEGFVVAGSTKDGVIEALEHPIHPYCISVQWHPEELAIAGDEHSKRLLTSFIKACKK